MSNHRHINFKLLRDRVLAGAENCRQDAGAPYWRSLEELAGSPEFEELVRHEFPQQAESWDDPVERRTFLKLMGASLALAGFSGCVIQPPEKVIPYVRQPEEEIPGKGIYFATAYSLGGIATPLLVRSNEGRPTKVEGNPDHPSNAGSTATDIFSQASILTLYDPDRSQTPLYRGETRAWTTFVGEIRGLIEKENEGLKARKGAGLRFLTEPITSPTLAAQMKQVLTDFPEAKWHQYEPVNRDNARAGAVMALGQPMNTTYDFSQAERILSLGSDFLSAMPGTLRYARDFAARRRLYAEAASTGYNDQLPLLDPEKNVRLYVVESTPSITGANADHRFSVKPGEMVAVAQGVSGAAIVRAAGDIGTWLPAVSKDLQLHKGASIVIAGDEQPPEVHALAHAANNFLGNVGKTVFYSDPIEANSVDQTQSLRELVTDIDAGKVELLIIIGGNPAYNTPVDLRLDYNRLNKVKLRAHLSLYNDETSESCHWHINATHYLESWGDTRAYDGTATIVQPLIAPLYEGKTAYEVLALFGENYDQKPYDMVRGYWSGQQASLKPAAPASRASATPASAPGQGSSPTPTPAATPNAPADFESWWRKCLHDGFIPNTALPTRTVSAKSDLANSIQNNA